MPFPHLADATTVVLLPAPAGGATVRAAPAGLPRSFNGLPTTYVDRPALAAGTYATAGVEVRPADLARLAAAFDRMRANGVVVPVVADHDEAARSTLGYVVGLRVDGGRLVQTQQLLGAESLATAMRAGSAVAVDRDLTDGYGRRYGPAIRHVAAITGAAIGRAVYAASLAGPGGTAVLTADEALTVMATAAGVPPERIPDLLARVRRSAVAHDGRG